jgi:hypothetical protein
MIGNFPEKPPCEFFGKIGLIFCLIPVKHFFQLAASPKCSRFGCAPAARRPSR